MTSYFALQSPKVFAGSWQQCLQWADIMQKESKNAIQLIKARAGDKKARVIAEVSNGYLMIIPHGIQYSIRDLRKRVDV